jgi:hypothetical protein
LSGIISTAGTALVAIDMNSVDSGITIRDQRMRELLFETSTYPNASIEVVLPSGLLTSLGAGQTTQTDISARVTLHGVTSTVTTRVLVQRLTNSRILVQSIAPIITRAADFNLVAGVESLRSIASLVSISPAVPVDFALAFDAR